MKNVWDIKISVIKSAENRNLRSGFISKMTHKSVLRKRSVRECGDRSVRELDLTKVAMKVHIL